MLTTEDLHYSKRVPPLSVYLSPNKRSRNWNRFSPLQNLGPNRQVLNQIANLFACVLRNFMSTIVLVISGIRTKLQQIKAMALPRIRCPVDVRSGEIKAYRIAAWMEHIIVWSTCFRKRSFAGGFRQGNSTVGTWQVDLCERNTAVGT